MSGLTFVPRHKRRQQADRLHGAFSGGFSAGYFNTVGSREGWQPKDASQSTERQSVADFMDEQDHTDWGGPRQVRRDMAAGEEEEEEGDQSKHRGGGGAAELLDVVIASSKTTLVPPKNVGQRLLKELGWRGDGNNSVYVPLDPSDKAMPQPPTTVSATEGAPSHEERMFLSKRRLRKIQIQQKHIHKNIPVPKLDSVGLGFEAHKNAPEFQAYRRRQRAAQKNHQQQNGNVYRLSDILKPSDGNDAGERGGHRSDEPPAGDDLGVENRRSVSGFALQDDEDEAYDNGDMNKGEYDTEIINHSDDSDAPQQTRGAKKNNTTPSKSGLGGALAAWARHGTETTAGGDEGNQPENRRRAAVDGRPVLSGFVPASGSGAGTAHNQRFRGPDIPSDYAISPHVFAPRERPRVLQALARATQLEQTDARRQVLLDQALQAAEVKRAPQSPVKREPAAPSVGATTVFVGLAESMKNRFTSASTQSSSPAKPLDKNDDAASVTRTTQVFVPSSLLCKRFRVPVPEHQSDARASLQDDTPRGEEKFFQDNILNVVATATKASSGKNREPAAKAESTVDEEQLDRPERPSMEVYRSIFASPSGDDRDASEASEDAEQVESHSDEKPAVAPDKRDKVPNDVNQQPDDVGVSSVADHESKNRKSHRRKRTWSSDSSADDSYSDEERERRKERRKRKKKRKKEKRARRRSRDSDDRSRRDLQSDGLDSKSRKSSHKHKSKRAKH